MYSFESRVRFSEVDESGAMSVPALIDYLQDCSLFQAEELGRGVTHAREARLVWLLAAWKIQILRMPRFTDPIRVSTWATAFKGLFAHRNFTVAAPAAPGTEAPGAEGTAQGGGELLARADSMWFLYDSRTGHPVRPTPDEVDPYAADLRDAPLDMPAAQRRIPVQGEGVACDPVVVTAAHIDTNHHVNNAQYVAMAMGALSTRAVEFDAREVDVQYLEAARMGDTIVPVVHPPLGEDVAGQGYVVSLESPAGQRFAVVRVL